MDPGTNVDTAFAEDAFGLVDMEKLLGLYLIAQVVAIDHGKLIVVSDRRDLHPNLLGSRHLLRRLCQRATIRGGNIRRSRGLSLSETLNLVSEPNAQT